MEQLMDALQVCPVIAAVKDEAGLAKALKAESQVVFLLFGTVCTIEGLVRQVKAAGKWAFVHIDLIEGLSAKEVAVDYIHEHTACDGVISTKAPLLSRAKALGLVAVQRVFAIDSMALGGIIRQLAARHGDFVELLPGAMPKVISTVAARSPVPVIAGGLISDKEDVIAALSAGATAVSTTKEALWAL